MFTLDERLWVCSVISGTINQPACVETNNLKSTSRAIHILCKRYNLNLYFVRIWLKAYRQGTLREITENLWLNHRGWRGPISEHM